MDAIIPVTEGAIDERTLKECVPKVLGWRHDLDTETVRRALYTAARAHRGQFRASGEPFITHPIAVASLLAHLGADTDCVAAGLLHDTIEDTAVTLGDIASDFGSNVAELVHSVTKPCPGTEAPAMEIASYYARRRTVHRVAESERRILVVKIADRLHNMFTLGALGSWKRQTYSQETMRVFVPVARAFGLVGAELELSRLAAVYA